LYSKSDVNFEEVNKERNELLKSTFKDLSKMAKDAKVKITTALTTNPETSLNMWLFADLFIRSL
jgi:hypothetical protein